MRGLHQIDRVPADPQRRHGGQNGQRYVEDHNERTPQIAEKHEDHQTRQHRTQRTLGEQTLHGADDVGRLVELEGDPDVFW